MPTTTPIDLECATVEELRAIARNRYSPIRHIASALLKSRKYRASGKTALALTFESYVDSAYKRLPRELQW